MTDPLANADLFAVFLSLVENGTLQSFDGWVIVDGLVVTGLIVSLRRYTEEFQERAVIPSNDGPQSFSETHMAERIPSDVVFEALYMLDAVSLLPGGGSVALPMGAFRKHSISAWGFSRLALPR